MIALIDIGGTNTRLATSENGQTICEPVIIKTPQIFDEAIKQIDQQLKDLTATSPIETTVIGIPGILDQDHLTLTNSPNLLDWIDRPIAKEFAKITNAPVHLINDADLAGLGEAAFGTGKDYNIVAYLTISTGVGGTRIVDKKIDRASHGFEPGRQIIDANCQFCPDSPQPTTLEYFIGGANMEKRYHQSPQNINDPKIWQQAAEHLAIGLNNVIMFWSPDIIILGGPMMRDIPIEQVRRHLNKIIQVNHAAPPIVPAALGQFKALYGGLAFLNSRAT